MDRRDVLKAVATGAMVPGLGVAKGEAQAAQTPERSGAIAPETRLDDWTNWPDVRWTGPAFWGNRLQDWRIVGGRAVCDVTGRNRTLHSLTHTLADREGGFETAVTIHVPSGRASDDASVARYVGLRIGAKGPRPDPRSAAVYGEGLDVGVTGEGRLMIGGTIGRGPRIAERAEPVVDVATGARVIRLHVQAQRQSATAQVRLRATDADTGAMLAELEAPDVRSDQLVGTIALVSHADAPDAPADSAAFSNWTLTGSLVDIDLTRTFGPVCFTMYTLHDRTLKLTAQLAPIEAIAGYRIMLEVQDAHPSQVGPSPWRAIGESPIDPASRTAHFRVDDWRADRAVSFRVRVALPLAGGLRHDTYEGTIAREPKPDEPVTLACFSCNADHGFPDVDVAPQVALHGPHLAVFLGDQIYESHGGFGVQHAPLDRAYLDYLRKWYMFGWSYRDVFRHIPVAILPDDHDVWHGNVWGESGKVAPTDKGWGYDAQDLGGYKMPADWVNAVQRTQTSHLPDGADAVPVLQDIGVYFTEWRYGGVSMALVEDRKFKSAPGNVLPASALVVNGFATAPGFDHATHRDPKGAQLLGERQLAFVERWAAARDPQVRFKVMLSQSPFCAVHTLPVGATNDQMVPKLPLPMPGEYVPGDAPAADMDTNGWPAPQRDTAVRLLRQAGALHIAGDQHLATVVQYGIDSFADGTYAFTVPALNNIWPRRWWPTLPADHEPMPGGPRYTGAFRDAFGNRLTVHAVANPQQTGRVPAIIHDRSTGYGIVVFDPRDGTIRLECWPRAITPGTSEALQARAEPRGEWQAADGQYRDWPITIRTRS